MTLMLYLLYQHTYSSKRKFKTANNTFHSEHRFHKICYTFNFVKVLIFGIIYYMVYATLNSIPSESKVSRIYLTGSQICFNKTPGGMLQQNGMLGMPLSRGDPGGTLINHNQKRWHNHGHAVIKHIVRLPLLFLAIWSLSEEYSNLFYR